MIFPFCFVVAWSLVAPLDLSIAQYEVASTANRSINGRVQRWHFSSPAELPARATTCRHGQLDSGSASTRTLQHCDPIAIAGTDEVQNFWFDFVGDVSI